MSDALQSYVNLVGGLTRATRRRALDVARAMLAQAGLSDVAADAGERVSRLADELVKTGRANRELMEKLVAAEVERTATRLGFARSSDVDELREEVAALRTALAAATAEPVSARTGGARKAAAPRKTSAPRKSASPRKSAAAAAGNEES